LYEQLHKHPGEVFRELAQRKDCRIEEGRLMPDHVRMMISIPPKYAVLSGSQFESPRLCRAGLRWRLAAF
jgi:REP element-mobilizing transposase RayT